jgi:small subunit ribosomal protein S17
MADDETTEAADTPAAEPAAAAPEAPAADTPAEAPAEEAPAEAPAAAKPKRARAAAKPAAAKKAAAAPAPAEEDEGPSARAPRGVKPKKKDTGPKRAKTKSERGTYTRTPAAETAQGHRKERRGVVVSDAGDKTITIRVDVMISHPKYKKIMRRSVKLRAHDDTNQAKVGDVVRIEETRPLSKTKRWRLIEIVEVAK